MRCQSASVGCVKHLYEVEGDNSIELTLSWERSITTDLIVYLHSHDFRPPTWLPSLSVMSQSIPTGYIPPPGNPGENFFERANPGHPGKIFCLIPCPGAKNDGRIPGGGAKFSQTRRNCSLSLQKNP